MNGSVLVTHCRQCGMNVSYVVESAGGTAPCPRCGGDVHLPGHAQVIAPRVWRRRTSPPGLAMEIGGFLLLMWFPIGTILGFVLIVVGYRQSRRLVCGNCERDLPNETLRRCPSCKSALADE